MELVDQIHIVYKRLFSIRFVHEGYRGVDVIANSVSMKPDTETSALFRNHHMLYRFSEDTLTCLIQCDEINDNGLKERPHVMFTGDELPIRFLMNASTGFFRRTAINAAGPKQVYYFSNKENEGNNMTLANDDDAVKPDDLENSEVIKNEEPCLAVIDIHINGITDAEYALLDNKQYLVDNFPEYKITFTSLILN